MPDLSNRFYMDCYGFAPLSSFHKHFPSERPWPFQSLSLYMFLFLRPEYFEQPGLDELSIKKIPYLNKANSYLNFEEGKIRSAKKKKQNN